MVVSLECDLPAALVGGLLGRLFIDNGDVVISLSLFLSVSVVISLSFSLPLTLSLSLK